MDVLVIAPHPDDECLGAGGTIAGLADDGARITVLTVGGHLPPLYPPGVHEEAVADARRAHRILGVTESVFLDFPAVVLARYPVATLNGAVQEVVDATRPRIVLIPFPDRHVDHRAVFEAAMVATRPVRAGRDTTMVAMYETLSETYWNAPGAEPTFSPTWTVDISATIDRKTRALAEYRAQVSEFPGPRSTEAARALALFRGSQSSVPYAEAFQIARATFAPTALIRPGPGREGDREPAAEPDRGTTP
ncbi:PIG-L deacetylase family protein [Polymorphospora lycopeni]|uniref:PIG-L deacetylase family protein n=1 Tax=Polymorphospora lycopeni TaxID=3140240 RepID=A0ABV5CQF6_9ACTN